MKEWLRSNEKAVYRIINAGILTGAVLLGGEGFLGIGGLDRMHLLTALAVLALAAGLNYMGTRGRILCLGVILVFLVTGAAAAGAENSAAFLEAFFPWLMGGEAPEEWKLGYGLLQTGLITGMCYLLQVLFEKVPAVKAGFAVLDVGVMLIFMFARREMNHYGVAFQFCFLVVVLTEGIQSRWMKRRSGRGGREAHTLWIMPFLAVYLLLLMCMPVPDKPYDWLWARNIYHQLQETFLVYTRNLKWGSREGFGMSFSGFSEEGELRGDLVEESGQVMKVSVSGGFSENSGENVSGNGYGGFAGSIYLTGRVYDTFDGRGWRQEWAGHEGDVFLDTAETLYAVRKYNRAYQRDYLREILLDIRYEDFQTGYVFAPLKTWSVTDGNAGEEPDYICSGGSLRWRRQRGYGTEYGLRYFCMNVGQKEFDRFLEEMQAGSGVSYGVDREILAGSGMSYGEDRKILDGDPVSYGESQEISKEDRELWEEVQRESERQNGGMFTLEDLARYREEMNENYLEEIRLSPEVRNYLVEIIGTAVTDGEKLRAIEEELSSFSYTLTPGELPEEVKDAGDFLDYFLLESRQGYCTYFATAFVLLARAEGIPARYVQGYCVPMPENGEVFVDSSMAHAWPEVYLEGVGWIPFEPTPGYGEGRYVSWEPVQPEGGSLPGEKVDTLNTPGSGGEKEDTEADRKEKEEESREESNDEESREETYKGTGAESEEEQTSFSWRLLGVAVPVILAIGAAVFGADYALSRYRYTKSKPLERFRKEVFRNLEILSWFGPERREWETLEELRQRAEQLPVLNGAEEQVSRSRENTKGRLLLQFIEDYESVIYGKEEVGEDMLTGALKEREELLLLLKKEKKWAYLYCRMGLLLGRYR